MPYQEERKKSPPDAEANSPPKTEDTIEQLDEHAHGADLLLSLTKKSRIHRLVTPPDVVTANGTASESKRVGDMEPAPAPNQRILYHSPIKIGSNGGLAKKPRSDPNALLSSELAPYAMVPAWSPSVYNGMAAPPYAPSLGRNHTNASCHRPVEEKKELEVAEEDDEEEDDGKQRLISPSSSNEKLDEEAPTDPPPRWERWPHPPPHHPMYHPPWPHPGYPVPPPYPPHAYPMYAPYPPPPPHWVMYGAPPPHAPPYPAYSSRPASGAPSPPAQKPKKTKENVRSRESSPDTTPETPDKSSSLNRCVPLQQPMPKRLWSTANAERRLPDFAQLINFPDKGNPPPPGTKQCVMCGKFRLCSAGSHSQGRRAKSTTSTDTPEDETTHIIPRQNKGVCTVCDVAVWVVQGPEGLEIKWCKGCKNFRPWAAFGDKGMATKCVRCRKRQKEKYATQKISSSGRGLLAPRGATVAESMIRNRTVKGSVLLS